MRSNISSPATKSVSDDDDVKFASIKHDLRRVALFVLEAFALLRKADTAAAGTVAAEATAIVSKVEEDAVVRKEKLPTRWNVWQRPLGTREHSPRTRPSMRENACLFVARSSTESDGGTACQSHVGHIDTRLRRCGLVDPSAPLRRRQLVVGGVEDDIVGLLDRIEDVVQKVMKSESPGSTLSEWGSVVMQAAFYSLDVAEDWGRRRDPERAMFLYWKEPESTDETLRSRLEPGHLEATAAIHCAYLIMRCDQVRDLPEIIQKRWWNRIAGLAEQVLALWRKSDICPNFSLMNPSSLFFSGRFVEATKVFVIRSWPVHCAYEQFGRFLRVRSSQPHALVCWTLICARPSVTFDARWRRRKNLEGSRYRPSRASTGIPTGHQHRYHVRQSFLSATEKRRYPSKPREEEFASHGTETMGTIPEDEQRHAPIRFSAILREPRRFMLDPALFKTPGACALHAPYHVIGRATISFHARVRIYFKAPNEDRPLELTHEVAWAADGAREPRSFFKRRVVVDGEESKPRRKTRTAATIFRVRRSRMPPLRGISGAM